MIIDCYGNRFPHKGFEQKRPYMVNDDGNGVIYMCYSDAAVKPIIRVTDDGNGTITQEWAYGSWADKATLTYVPINNMIEV